jgi:hypothetical protein
MTQIEGMAWIQTWLAKIPNRAIVRVNHVFTFLVDLQPLLKLIEICEHIRAQITVYNAIYIIVIHSATVLSARDAIVVLQQHSQYR